jgi:6-pyruvoyltetrahydropterin/6-carboxytetrahydropterin synthase
MELTVEFVFSAAHHLDEAEGRCRTMHGHDYRLLVTVAGPVRGGDGMVMDFHEIDDIVTQTVLTELEGQLLNDVLPTPTAERLAEWIRDRLRPVLPGLSLLTIYETPRYKVTLVVEP